MDARNSLLALSVLAALGNGIASAAPVTTYDAHAANIFIPFAQLGGTDILVENAGPAVGITPAQYAAAALDDVGTGNDLLDGSEVLTINTSYFTPTAFSTAQTQQVFTTINGSWNDTTFSAAGGSFLMEEAGF